MANTEYKTRTLPKRIKPAGPEARLTSCPAPLFGGPWRQSLGASDYTPAAFRPVLSQHTGGAGEWLVSDDAPGHPQTHPEVDVWRTVMVVPSELAPGCALALRVVAVRSGMSEELISTWMEHGTGGRVRVAVEFWRTSGDDDTATAELELAPSLEENGAEPSSAGASWNNLLFGYLPILYTDEGIEGEPLADRERWSENTTIIATVQHEGGARVIHCSLTELPFEHVADHETEVDVSIHGWPPTVKPTVRPQTAAADGTTYEEHRFGTARGFAAALRQSQRLGSTIAAWTAYAEDLAEVDDTNPDPVQVTSSTFVGLSVGAAITEWSTDAPGYDVAGHYAARAPENLTTRLDGATAIPVRCRVHARFTAAGSNIGVVRFQVSPRSWVDVEIDQAEVGTTWTWVTITGELEGGVAADDTWPVLVDFAKVSGGTLEIRYWRVMVGDYEVGA